MAETGTSRPVEDWQQIRVNLPADFYATLRERSARHGTSLSAEAFRLMRIGLAGIKPNDNLAADLVALRRYLELHLEALTYRAAVDAGYSAEAWRWQLATAYKTDRERFAEADHKMRERATRRVQRALHDMDPDGYETEVTKDGEATGEDDGD